MTKPLSMDIRARAMARLDARESVRRIAGALSIAVTSRVIVDALPEQLGSATLPFLEGVDGRSPLQGCLRELAVVEVDVAQEGLLQVLAALEAVALKDILVFHA